MIAHTSARLRTLVTLLAVSLAVPVPGSSAGAAPVVPPAAGPLASSSVAAHARAADPQPVVAVEAAKREDPSFNLRDGYEISTVYAGQDALASALANDEVESLSLAVGDFDGD